MQDDERQELAAVRQGRQRQADVVSHRQQQQGPGAAALILSRRVKSENLGPGASDGSTGSSVMPQIGQLPGASRMISGCIGQVYFVATAATLPRLSALPEA